ncbi:MAG TPA: 23S rRNA (uracil(1939)-C(5))-methyltransferase RlmD [Deltaproteobacteria bacterium]|nr:23S rRNA (uracil(1939)-C(5))-methyltransferase RlmD [Deltaproteobacteria bacterium]
MSSTESQPSGTVPVEISDFAMPRDLGVGRWEGRVIFVPGAVPGDRVRAELGRGGKAFIYGRMVGLESASPWRREPPCPHFGSCGGCSLLHFDYVQQLELKRRHLVETFRRVGGFKVDPTVVSPSTPSVDRFFYRGKIELACRGRAGNAVLGLRKRVSPFEPYHGEVTPIDSCAIFSRRLGEILPALREYMARFDVPAFDEKLGRGFLKEITVRESKSTGDMMLVFDTGRGELPGAQSLIQSVQRAEPSVKSICRLYNGRTETLRGQGWIEETVGELSFQISPTVFFQPNPKTAHLLYEKVIEFARSFEAKGVMGLYCGMGTLEMTLSRSIEWVEGYDAEPENIRNARRNCEINGIRNCRFHAKRVEEIDLQRVGRPFDLAVVDPPRTGMSKLALKSLVDLSVPAIAYVSCDPATLARDLNGLMAGGYRLIQVMPFDFFPHTSHLETLVFLQKK